MTNVVQRNFAGGELAPACYARTDQVKYATGLRTCRNFLVQRHGGVANRPGTRFVDEAKDSAHAPWLRKFVFNDDQTYVLEFGDKYLRFYHAGGRLLVSGVAAWVSGTAYIEGDLVVDGAVTYYCRADHTAGASTEPGVGNQYQTKWAPLAADIYEIPTPYLVADLPALKYTQSADVVTFTHPSYPVYELKRFGQTRWTMTRKTFGPSIATPNDVNVSGGSADADSTVTYAITAVADGDFEESLPIIAPAGPLKPDPGDPSASPPVAPTPIALAWGAVVGATEYNIYRSDDGFTFGFIGTSGGTPLTAMDSTWDTGSDTLDAVGPGATDSTGQARNTLSVGANGHATDEQYTVSGTLQLLPNGPGELDATNVATALVFAYYSRDGETRQPAGLAALLDVTGEDSFAYAFTVPDNGYSALVIDLVVTLDISDDSSWEAVVTGTSVSWKGNKTGFSDPAIDPDFSLAPPVQQSIFNTPESYPSCTGYYQQRQFYANTTSKPELVRGSRTGNFSNFSTSTPLQDDDAIAFVLAGNKVNAVRALLDLESLVVFTQGGVYVPQGDVSGTLTPTAINAKRIAERGIHPTLPPVVIDASALYVQARGSIIRDLRNDPVSGYNGNDLTIFATHLFNGYTIVDWDYAETPNSVVWAVRSDGVLLGLTYIPEQAIWGWHRHDTDGAVERVCVVPEGEEDAVYVLVRRTVNGATKRYIERFASRFYPDLRDAFFVDCGLSYDGRNTSATTMTLSGGVAWDNSEQLTCTASAAFFSAADVGNGVYFTANDGSEVRCMIEAYTSPTVVTVRPVKLVPAELRNAATTVWSRAADTFTGLDHLEGKAVSVYADGYVAASPNNSAYPAPVVTGGSVTLDRPYAVVHIGLPFISDLETLDIDTPQGPSLKDKMMLVNKLGIWVEGSRGIWAGGAVPTGDDPLEGLGEYKQRSDETYDEPTQPVTDAVKLTTQNSWNSHGRVLVRQVDPLPTTVLAVIPQGFLPTGG